MSLQMTSVFIRSFFVANRVSQQFINKRGYCRWISRRHSKVLFPKVSSNQEKIIDLSEHYKSKYKEDEDFQEENGAFPVQYNQRHKPVEEKSEIAKESYENQEGLFDFDMIDAETQGLKRVQRQLKKKQLLEKKDDNSLSFKSRKQNQRNSNQETQVAKDVFDSNGNYIYDKLPYKDAVIGNQILKLKIKKNRERMKQLLVEGWRLIVDGLQAGCLLDTLIFSQLSDLEQLKPFMPKKGVQIYKMPYREIQMWSQLDTSPGLIAIFKTPNMNIDRRNEVYPINVICDNIRDPGNLGSILRACLGVGCSSVFLTKGCVDIWDNKVLRSGAGAQFRMPIKTNMSWEDISNSINSDSTVVIADNKTNDSHMRPTMPVENDYDHESDDSASDTDSDEEDMAKLACEIPLTQYYKLDYHNMDSVTLIVGGETEGISSECYKFGRKRAGVRINIPLTGGVDSLNSSMAVGVIAFEIKKQMLEAGFSSSKKIKAIS